MIFFVIPGTNVIQAAGDHCYVKEGRRERGEEGLPRTWAIQNSSHANSVSVIVFDPHHTEKIKESARFFLTRKAVLRKLRVPNNFSQDMCWASHIHRWRPRSSTWKYSGVAAVVLWKPWSLLRPEALLLWPAYGTCLRCSSSHLLLCRRIHTGGRVVTPAQVWKWWGLTLYFHLTR